MRILFVSEFFYPRMAGGEIWAWELCKELAKRGHEITVITCRYGDLASSETKDGVRILRPVRTHDLRPVRKIATMLLARHVKKYVVHNKPDVIHTTAYNMNLSVSRIAKKHGIPCITSVHSYFGDEWRYITPFWPFLKWLERGTLKRDRSGIMHVLASGTKHEVDKLGRRAVVIPNFIDERKIIAARKTKASVIRKRYNVKGRMLLYVGSLIKVKNVEEIIRQAQRADGEVTLLIAGSGPEQQNLQKYISQHKISGKHIRLVGQVDEAEKFRLIASCDALVLLSKSEQFPLTVLEALALNKDVLATSVGAIPDIAKGTKRVHVITPNQLPLALAKVNAGKGINRKVLHRYSKRRIVDEFLALYKSTR